MQTAKARLRRRGERMKMVALGGHPNIDVMVFYLLASALLAATLSCFHREQI
jgi:hypothetical protein